MQFYVARICTVDHFCSCDLDLDPINDLHIQTWAVLPGDIADVQTRTSYVKAFESYHLTDIQTHTETESTKIIYHAALQVVNKL